MSLSESDRITWCLVFAERARVGTLPHRHSRLDAMLHCGGAGLGPKAGSWRKARARPEPSPNPGRRWVAGWSDPVIVAN